MTFFSYHLYRNLSLYAIVVISVLEAIGFRQKLHGHFYIFPKHIVGLKKALEAEPLNE
jgi:hypothetical protein